MRPYLYHYTTIENLALILKNQTIRFSKLTNTDDLEESKTSDIGEAGQYIFVSCWTDKKDENIPLWHMYSSKLSGVRISLPFLPFKEYDSDILNSYPSFNDSEIESLIKSPKIKTYIPDSLNKNQNYMINASFNKLTTKENIKVFYTDDEKLIMPVISEDEITKKTIKFGLIGKYKRSCWRFQEEYRYRLWVLPIGHDEIMLNHLDPDQFESGFQRIKDQVKLDFDFIDLLIDQEDFNKMEIVLGPGVTESQRTLVDCLVATYNPKAKISDSQLIGRIKTR